jgi:hypothetical protein
MHYFLRDPLEELADAHLEFLKKELSRLDWAKADAEKLLEVQAEKLCDDSAGGVPVSRGRAAAHKKQARKKRKKKANS